MANPAPGSPGSLGLPGLIPALPKGPGLRDARPAANLTGSLTCFEDNPWQQREQKQRRLLKHLHSSCSSHKATVSRVADVGAGGTPHGAPVTLGAEDRRAESKQLKSPWVRPHNIPHGLRMGPAGTCWGLWV